MTVESWSDQSGSSRLAAALIVLGVLLSVVACDRNIEPFVPGEQPRKPDLSRIFAPEAAAPDATLSDPRVAPGSARGLPSAPPSASDGEPVRGTIEIAPELASRVRSGSVLFVVARAGAGTGPPLAVKRVIAPEFPLAFEIGADDVMMPGSRFAGEIRISARLDSDGNATTRTPGDLSGSASGAFAPGARGVLIVLDELVGDAASAPAGRAVASPSARSSIRGVIDVAPENSGNEPAGAVLFVVARTGQGRGPPLAALRIGSPEFPQAFTIGPADMMIPGRRFEGQIRITARLDSDGDAATRSPGDLTGAAAAPVAAGTSDLRILLDQKL